jgi:hypothetical protein
MHDAMAGSFDRHERFDSVNSIDSRNNEAVSACKSSSKPGRDGWTVVPAINAAMLVNTMKRARIAPSLRLFPFKLGYWRNGEVSLRRNVTARR